MFPRGQLRELSIPRALLERARVSGSVEVDEATLTMILDVVDAAVEYCAVQEQARSDRAWTASQVGQRTICLAGDELRGAVSAFVAESAQRPE